MYYYFGHNAFIVVLLFNQKVNESNEEINQFGIYILLYPDFQ